MIHEVYGGTVLDLKERLTFRAADNLRFIARGGCFGRTSNRPNHDDRYTDYNAGNTVDSSFSPPRPHSATWRIDFDRRFNDNYAIYAAISGRYLSEPDCTCKSDQAYSIWKLTLQQRIWRGISLNLAIDNLFNYRPEVYYWNSLPTTGISCSIGISINTDHLFKKRQAEYKSSKNGKNQ